MTDPSVDSGILAKALDWLWAGVLALVGIIYKTNEKKLEKLDEKIEHEVRCARIELKSKADADDVKGALNHIETLFANAETDRSKTRDMIEKASDRMNDIMQLNQREVMRAIADIKQSCVK